MLPKIKNTKKSKVKNNNTKKKSLTNQDAIKGLFKTLSNSNSLAQQKVLEQNNKSNFEPQVLNLLGQISENTDYLKKNIDKKDKKKGLLSGLLSGLSMLLTPLLGSITGAIGRLALPLLRMTSMVGLLRGISKSLMLTRLARLGGAGVGGLLGAMGKKGGKGKGKGLKRFLPKLSKGSAKAGIKGIAKMGGRLLPGVGLALGAGYAVSRLKDGDVIGALGEAASGVASMLPGLGTTVSLGIQSALTVRDVANDTKDKNNEILDESKKGFKKLNESTDDIVKKQKDSVSSFSDSISKMTDKTTKAVSSGITSMMTTVEGFAPKVLDIVKNNISSVINFAMSPLKSILNTVQGLLPSSISSRGADIINSAGNVIDRVSKPFSNPSSNAKDNFKKVKADLKNAAQNFGIDSGLLAKIAYFESGKSFNPNAAPVSSKASQNTVYNKGVGKMAMSSAHGLGQFIDSTWRSTLRKHGDDMGIRGASKMSNAQLDGYRSNQRIQAMALAAHAKDNLNIARQYSGGDKAADVYALHNLGQSGGKNFLKKLQQNPNAKVSSILSNNVIKRNKSLYGNGNISLRQAYKNMQRYMSDGDYFANEMNGGSVGLVTRVTNKAKSIMGAPQSTKMGDTLLAGIDSRVNQMKAGKDDLPSANVTKTNKDSNTNTNTPTPLTKKDGDKIAAAAESMVGDNTVQFGLCARAVWFILGKAGIPGFPKTKSKSNLAKYWGSSGIHYAKQAVPILLKRGFREISPNETPQNGDVDVLGPRTVGYYKGKKVTDAHPGHIQVYANGSWYSDHKQKSRYNTSRYKWMKTFRYGSGGSSSLSYKNDEPNLPSINSTGNVITDVGSMMQAILQSDKLDGLRDFIKGGELDAPTTDRKRVSAIQAIASNETFNIDFGLGANKNGAQSNNLKRVLLGSKDRQKGDITGIRNTTGFMGSKDRQLADTKGIRNTTGFMGSLERQMPDITGIRNTTGFMGSKDRQETDTTGIRNTAGFMGSKDRQKDGSNWFDRIFGKDTFNILGILGDLFPSLNGILGLIKNNGVGDILNKIENKDYAGVVGTITGNKKYEKLINDIDNKNYESILKDIIPTNDFINNGMTTAVNANLDNNIKLNNLASASIITPPNNAPTITKGNANGASIPITLRNNDSIIKEIAKDYLRNSL